MNGNRAIPAIETLRAAAGVVGRDAGYRLMVLYGSAARCDGAPPRDIDIGVLADDRLDTIALTNRLIRAFGIQAVDVADLRRADPLLLMSVARDGIPLYERSAGEFARFASLAVRRYADTRKFRDMEAQEIRDFIELRPTT